jgi:putative ABC transport system permease protein
MFNELRNKLLGNPKIINASVSSNSPAHGSWGITTNWEGGTEDQSINTLYNEVDYNFINTFEMKIAKGRNFSKEFTTDTSACIINETLAGMIGWNNPIGKKLFDKKYTIIGVVKDFHPTSVHEKIRPLYDDAP